MNEQETDADKQHASTQRPRTIRDWAMDNQYYCVTIGVLLILLGIIFSYVYEEHKIVYWMVLSHLLVILGEAVVVMFFLHIVVEEQNNEYSHKKLDEQTLIAGQKMSELISGFKKEANSTIDNIKENLFEAILMDKMPHQIVKVVLDSKFFNAEILRRNLKMTFKYLSHSDDTLVITQKNEFEIEYISGADLLYNYEMGFGLTETPIVKYKLINAGYKKRSEKSIQFGEGDIIPSKRGFSLAQPIPIEKNERIKFHQLVEATYKMGEDGVVDNYFTRLHTINMSIDIIDFPDEYVFTPYPTFPSKGFENPDNDGTKISYEKIEFLVPGQGFLYSFSKKNKTNN
jgi:hypothetical protein